MKTQTNAATIKAVRRVLEIHKSSQGLIRPHFILTGPSGSGKSHTIQTLVEEMELGFLEINAAALTKEGTSGNSLSKALTPLLQYGDRLVVCFVDEFDKLFISGNSNSELAHETTNGVQNEFLKVLESDTASVFGDYGKYFQASVKNVLFIFAGAFNGQEEIDLDTLREFGIKTEFLGRVGLTFGLEKLSLEDMLDILETSPLLDNYLALFEKVRRKVVIERIGQVIKANYEQNTLGVRMINTLIHQYFIYGDLKERQAKQVTFQKKLTLQEAS
jgi:ATP-dependent protease Clp ATPase subunit